MNTLPPGFPKRVRIFGSQFWMKGIDAVRLIGLKRAHDLVLPDGSIAIELGHFGPCPSSPFVGSLPPSELAGVFFKSPQPAQYRAGRKLVRITRAFSNSQAQLKLVCFR